MLEGKTMAPLIKLTVAIGLITYEDKSKIISKFGVSETRWRVVQFIEAKNIRKRQIRRVVN